MRQLTTDRATGVFTVEMIGRTRELTPEGFLLCRDVPIARTGEMLYLPEEIGMSVKGGRDGIARVIRDGAELFRAETLASLLGKSVVDDHPDEDVTPTNWGELTGGVVLNPHAGEGAEADLLFADLLITRADTIAAVEAGKLEVSCGYDCDYVDLGEGRGRQHNIIFNHVALVENGRCGSRCSIGDHDMKTRDKRRSWKDRIMTAFKARDEAALAEAMQEAQDEMGEADEPEPQRLIIQVEGPPAPAAAATDEIDPAADKTEDEGEEAPAWFTAHVEQNNARFEKIEGVLSKLAGGTTDEAEGDDDGEGTTDAEGDEDDDTGTADEATEEEDKGSGTKDSANLGAAFRDVVARAEILAPGIKLPTYDSKATRKVTHDRMCALRRRALVAAMDGDHADAIKAVSGGRDVAKLTCDSLTPVFIAASELAKRANSAPRPGFIRESGSKSAPPSIADINKANREFWSANAH